MKYESLNDISKAICHVAKSIVQFCSHDRIVVNPLSLHCIEAVGIAVVARSYSSSELSQAEKWINAPSEGPQEESLVSKEGPTIQPREASEWSRFARLSVTETGNCRYSYL